MNQACSPTHSEAQEKNRVIFAGEAALPEELHFLSQTGFLTVTIEIDGEAGTVRSVECRELAPAVIRLVAGQLIGRNLQPALENSIEIIRKSYYARSKEALMDALRVIQRQFDLWKHECHQDSEITPGLLRGLSPTNPNEQHYNSGSYGKKSTKTVDRNTRHGLATQLITLLAYARLLDEREKRSSVGLEVSREARQQAIQLYAIAQQILHKVEAEPGLLQPQIEPISVPDLIHRTMFRLAASGRRLSIKQRLPADLPPIRGDAVVLEEAMFLLFGEMANCCGADESAWEIGAEKRKTDMLITIQRFSDGDDAGDGIAHEGDQPLKSQSTGFWDGNLGALAARALVEHQGGRLWIQETFPQDNSCLCLSLRT